MKFGHGRRSILGLGGVAALMASACGQPASTQQEVTIGVMLPLTGGSAAPEWADAANVALRDVNAGLASSGRDYRFRMELIDAFRPGPEFVTAAQELVASGAKALLTWAGVQGDLNALAYDDDASNDLGVPLLPVAASSPAINDPMVTAPPFRNDAGWTFANCMSSSYEARVAMRIVLAKGSMGDVNDDGIFKMGLYVIDNSYGNGYADALEAEALAQRSNGVVVERVLHDPTVDLATYDFSADLEKLADDFNESTGEADGAPDVIQIVTFTSYTLAATQAYATAGYDIPVFQTHGFVTPITLVQLGDLAQGQEGTTPVVAEDNLSGERFTQAMIDATDQGPTFFSPNVYDGMFASALAISLAAGAAGDPAEVTGADVRAALLEIDAEDGQRVYTGSEGFGDALGLIAAGTPLNFEGASGPMDWGPNQRAFNRVAHFTVDDDAYVDLGLYDCVASAECLPVE